MEAVVSVVAVAVAARHLEQLLLVEFEHARHPRLVEAVAHRAVGGVRRHAVVELVGGHDRPDAVGAVRVREDLVLQKVLEALGERHLRRHRRRLAEDREADEALEELAEGERAARVVRRILVLRIDAHEEEVDLRAVERARRDLARLSGDGEGVRELRANCAGIAQK